MISPFKTLLMAGVCCGALTASAQAGEAPAWSEGFFFTPYLGAAYTRIQSDFKTVDGYNYDEFYAEGYNSINPYVGARLHKHLGVELGYMNSDSQDQNKDFTAYGFNFSGKTETEIEAWTLDALGYYPIPDHESWEMIGSLGIGDYESDSKATVSSGSISSSVKLSESETGIRAGLGAQYFATENISVRGMLRYVHIDSETVDNTMEYSLGAAWHF